SACSSDRSACFLLQMRGWRANAWLARKCVAGARMPDWRELLTCVENYTCARSCPHTGSLRRRGSSLPALRGGVVAFASVDPAAAPGRVFLLPERRPGLEVVHDELARLERLAPVRARDAHQHDAVARNQRAHAVDHERVEELPARMGLRADVLEGALGHAGIVLERHALDGVAVVRVAHQA